MPLLAPVIKAARARAGHLKEALGSAHTAAWRSLLAPRWLPLPASGRRLGQRGSVTRFVNIAVDGTSHAVQLSTGAHFILAVAAASGPPPLQQRDRADMEIIPARYDDAQAASARDLLMRSLEAYVATDAASAVAHAGWAEQAILWIDGSLYADLAHMAGAPGHVRWGGAVERAGNLLRTTAALLDLAEGMGLWLIAIGKTQRAGFLFDALTATALSRAATVDTGRRVVPVSAASKMSDGLAAHQESGPEMGVKPADGELLATVGPGWSWPLVLDGTRFPIIAPVAREALKQCPAIVSCYVRPHAGDLPLRVDVPASMVGLDDRLLSNEAGTLPRDWPAWVPDTAAMQPVIETVLAAYGGVHIHNGPLYAVDRLVRLSRRDLETRYLPICAKVAGLPLDALMVDRGRRRFVKA